MRRCIPKTTTRETIPSIITFRLVKALVYFVYLNPFFRNQLTSFFKFSKMRIPIFYCALLMGIVCHFQSYGQIDARLMTHIDISKNHIAFVYGGDIWISPRAGGQAIQLTHSQGEESYPRFSPDGTQIAFSASYNGNVDVYTMPVQGGVPIRVTYASFYDRMLDWHPDGKRLLFASRREAHTPNVNELFMVSAKGGLPQKLELPYGELAKFSPDGKQLVYITKITENYPFKRYRGGLTSDILIYDLESKRVERITTDEANDGRPTWSGTKIYFLSDNDANLRRNIWEYDTQTKTSKVLTRISDFDIGFFSAYQGDLVFESGGTLYQLVGGQGEPQKLNIHVVSDLSLEMPQIKNVSEQIGSVSPSPDGNRVVIEARGELFNAPVKEGVTINLTHSSGAYDREPAWSPDGASIAYWSDKDGEYQLYIQPTDKTAAAKQLTQFKSGFGYTLYWSPDSKHIAYIDEKNNINIIEVASKKLTKADNSKYHMGHNGRFNYSINWSPDSKWITYRKQVDNTNSALFVYNLAKNKVSQITSGYYSDYNPVFDVKGEFIYYLTDRAFNSAYSGLGDGTWIYPNNTQIAAMALNSAVTYPLFAKNDTLTIGSAKKPKEDAKDNPKDDKKDSSKEVTTTIDLQDTESRITLLPIPAGNYRQLMSFDGKLVLHQYPITGDNDGNPSLKYYDFDKREVKTIMEGVNAAEKTGDGKSLLVVSRGKWGIIAPNENQKLEKPIPSSQLHMQWVAKEEWQQIFNDTWRRYRDFFYDKNMQQVDWDAMKKRYGALIKDARTRWDVSTLQSEMQAELSAGHTYTRGGDTESVKRVETGYLGINWGQDSKGYFISKLVTPAVWDTEVRSPLDRPGSNIRAGNYIHAVNGIALNPNQDPYAAFDGLAGQTVALSISSTGNPNDAKDHIVELLRQGEEAQLRYLAWIEANRKNVETLSNGKLGYVYMSNTGGQGQLELVKMFYGQLDKQGFIIDERFNGGGQLADRFLELMTRPSIYNLYWRHGEAIRAPQKTNTGPMGMLINGWAGSGGDALPWAFRELNVGPIVGERTLGILVGPATGHGLIDGGGITVPGARLYLNNGQWFDEGVGVRPDIAVWDDPNLLMSGRDPQLERVVSEVLKQVTPATNSITPPPAMEDRTAKGLRKN
ncbi:tricorn protease [Flavobacteriaceae bacterium MAR_2010_105]|nr:tricorn protease [Flavobacteriaceae bacterium MAR_2010_105]